MNVLALQRVGTFEVTVRPIALSLTLIVDEEERPVLHERAAEHAAELIPPVVRLHRIASSGSSSCAFRASLRKNSNPLP